MLDSGDSEMTKIDSFHIFLEFIIYHDWKMFRVLQEYMRESDT